MTEISNTTDFSSRVYLMASSCVEVDTTVEALWDIFVRPNSATYFNPFIKGHESEKIVGINHKDALLYFSDRTLNRETVGYEKLKKIKFKLHYSLNNKKSYSTFEIIEELNVVKCKLTLETDSYKHIPRPMWWLLARFILIPQYIKYANSTIRGIKYTLETGKKVSKNQFGYHSWFSTKGA